MRKIRKNDMVMVITGEDKKKTGRVLKVVDGGKKIVVERVNIVKRHTKPSQKNPVGGIVEKEMPIDISNVLLLTKEGKTTRVNVKYIETPDGKKKKVRFSKKYNEILD